MVATVRNAIDDRMVEASRDELDPQYSKSVRLPTLKISLETIIDFFFCTSNGRVDWKLVAVVVAVVEVVTVKVKATSEPMLAV